MLVSGASSSSLTGKDCSPNTVQWPFDSYALAVGPAAAVTQSGGKTWFTITVDYAFGHAMERDLKDAVTKNGGKIVGGVLTPLGTPDFRSEEHTSELQSLMRTSYAVFCLKTKKNKHT